MMIPKPRGATMQSLTTKPQPGAPSQDPRDDLAKLGVTAQDGVNSEVAAAWSDAELNSLIASYSKAFDPQPLKGLRVIREKAHPGAPNGQAMTHASEAECPTLQAPADKPHTHFYNLAFFNDPEDIWNVAADVRVPVHELGHVFIEVASGDPNDQDDFKAAKDRLDAYKIKEFQASARRVEAGFERLTPWIMTFQKFGKGTDLTDIAQDRIVKLGYTRALAMQVDGFILNVAKLTSSMRDVVSEEAKRAAYNLIHEARLLLEVHHYHFAEVWRILDYFIAMAQKYKFKPFSDNSEVNVIEWFAETYALVCIEPQSTMLPPEIAKWFLSGFPHCPTVLMDLVLRD
jgi:hypothetical protein